MQLFYTPQHARVGDVIPYYEDGKFHLFYLKNWNPYFGSDRKDGWHLLNTKDMVHYGPETAIGILGGTAVSAVPLTEPQRTALHAKLESLTGKTIDLKTKVDAKVLGGIRLDIEGTELDGTVQNRLAALRRDIASVTL